MAFPNIYPEKPQQGIRSLQQSLPSLSFAFAISLSRIPGDPIFLRGNKEKIQYPRSFNSGSNE